VPVRCLIRASEYHDSVTLMQIAQELLRLPGVQDAAVVMATAANKAVLAQSGLSLPEIEAASVNDLVVVVRAIEVELAIQALETAGRRLAQPAQDVASGQARRPRSLRLAARMLPKSYAAAEAWEALKSGLNVLLFSDNVSLDDEIALKKYAVERGLLMMGPGCGTAILNGVALGFANVVPRGPVGVVAAAGTGLQEVSTLLAKLGVGISQGIGTGGRDLHDQVGGMTMLQCLRALQHDLDTQVLLLVSKPPSAAVAERVLAQVDQCTKPTVVCFLGSDPSTISRAGALPARTLQEASYLAAAQVPGFHGRSAEESIGQETRRLRAEAQSLRGKLGPQQKYLRGLFSGGTLAAEALLIWRDTLGEVFSNVASELSWRLDDAARCRGNCALDLGEEEFTVGRPHPMIDNDLRIRRLLQEAADPEVAVVVLDVVLGYGAHPDPAGELGPAVRRAREMAAQDGRELLVVASVTGTQEDPQGLDRQVRALEQSGAVVCDSNAAAARLAAFILNG
jgi:FdrA protein